MNWRERTQQWLDRPVWRRHAPAAGSVVVHLAVVAVVAGLMASVSAQDAPRPKPEKRVMSVELVQLPEALPEAGVTPPPRAKPEASPKPIVPDKRRTAAPVTAAPADAGAADDNTFYVPPSDPTQSGIARSLAGLMGDDPCEARYGPKARECAGRELAKRTGRMDSVMARPKEQLAQFFGEFMPKCTMRVGCEGGEWISSMGTRSVAKPPPGSRDDHGAGSMMAGGAASVAGPNTIVGRLGFNAEHTDPGFGD
ncbi:MAG: hypothetical protein ABMA14_07675 [Hyphomonadaceae bacterium]